jgi:hypothetical protein
MTGIIETRAERGVWGSDWGVAFQLVAEATSPSVELNRKRCFMLIGSAADV